MKYLDLTKVEARMKHLTPLLKANLLAPGSEYRPDAEGKEPGLPALAATYNYRWSKKTVAPKLPVGTRVVTSLLVGVAACVWISGRVLAAIPQEPQDCFAADSVRTHPANAQQQRLYRAAAVLR